jgi:hypothetical protein
MFTIARIDAQGRERALGFWQDATENSDICEELLADMEKESAAGLCYFDGQSEGLEEAA